MHPLYPPSGNSGDEILRLSRANNDDASIVDALPLSRFGFGRLLARAHDSINQQGILLG